MLSPLLVIISKFEEYKTVNLNTEKKFFFWVIIVP